MSLLKKLSDKLDAILNEEEAENETSQNKSETKNVRQQKKQTKAKQNPPNDDWEDLDEEDDIQFSVYK